MSKGKKFGKFQEELQIEDTQNGQSNEVIGLSNSSRWNVKQYLSPTVSRVLTILVFIAVLLIIVASIKVIFSGSPNKDNQNITKNAQVASNTKTNSETQPKDTKVGPHHPKERQPNGQHGQPNNMKPDELKALFEQYKKKVMQANKGATEKDLELQKNLEQLSKQLQKILANPTPSQAELQAFMKQFQEQLKREKDNQLKKQQDFMIEQTEKLKKLVEKMGKQTNQAELQKQMKQLQKILQDIANKEGKQIAQEVQKIKALLAKAQNRN